MEKKTLDYIVRNLKSDDAIKLVEEFNWLANQQIGAVSKIMPEIMPEIALDLDYTTLKELLQGWFSSYAEKDDAFGRLADWLSSRPLHYSLRSVFEIFVIPNISGTDLRIVKQLLQIAQRLESENIYMSTDLRNSKNVL